MKTFIETHLGLVMLISAILGLLIPQAALAPKHTVTILLALVILIACIRTELHDFSQVAVPQVLGFWFVRFVALPPDPVRGWSALFPRLCRQHIAFWG